MSDYLDTMSEETLSLSHVAQELKRLSTSLVQPQERRRDIVTGT